jgi:hypothetical protein
MNLHKIALFTLLAACAQPAYSDSASTGAASTAPVAGPGTAQSVAPVAPSAGVARSAKRPSTAAPVSRWGPNSRAAPVLVIPAKEMDATTYGRIVEDLSVMSRIIEKGLRDLSDEVVYAPATIATRIEMFLPSDRPGPWILRSRGGRPGAMYVGGYGAVFSLQVDFPLIPPPQTSEPNKTVEKGDQVWAAAQRELANLSAPLAVRPGASQGKLYRPEAVESLRSALISLLKHATNIRDLEPDSWLTILVQGPGTVQPEELAPNPEGVSILGAYTTGSSLLTLRAKKADLEQFAKGQLDQAQFQQRVQIVTR